MDSSNTFHRLTWYSDDDCDSDEWGYDTKEKAPYISHMHYQNLNSRHWLFGATTTTNHAGNRGSYKSIVFMVELDGTTGDLKGTSEFYFNLLDRDDFG